MFKWLGGLTGLLLAGVVVGYLFVCPCEQIPGGPLGGVGKAGQVDDWSFMNEVPLCQVQVDRGIPWSINLNCMATPAGDLYVSCSRCAGKSWSNTALERPAGYIRAGEDVYPVTLRRVTDSAELDTAWAARAAKVGTDSARPDHWWSFALTSR